MQHKLKQLFSLIIFCGLISNAGLLAQTVRDYSLPVGPDYTFTLHGTPSAGYTFLGSYRFSSAANFPSTILIIDEYGAPVFLKDYPINDGTQADLRLYDNGLMSYFLFKEDVGFGQYYIMDSTFTVIDSVVCENGLKTDGHELLLLDNGNYLVICLEERIMDLTGLTTEDGFPGDPDALVIGAVIQELSPNKNLLFEWKGLDYFALNDIDPYFFLDPNFMDFGHPNALAIDLDGNILLSLRFFNEITKISRTDSSIIWRLGGKNNQFTFVNDTQQFSAQHHCVVLPNGNITMYDNGELGNVPLARGVEYELNTVNNTATKVWEHTNIPGLISYSLGSMYRMPNGNSLVNWGAGYAPGFMNDLEEVDANGNLVSEFNWPQDYFTYRAYKQTPTWNIEMQRPIINCDTTGGTTSLSVASSHRAYLWNTGDTTRNITITSPGEYYVMVSDSDGRGYFGSKLKVINDLLNPCSPADTGTSISSTSRLPFSIYPNPANNLLTLSHPGKPLASEVVLYNSLGVEVHRQLLTSNLEHIDVSGLNNGSYIGIVNTIAGKPEQYFKFMVAH